IEDVDSMFDLTGRIALVAGASSGLGEGFARLLSKAGAKVVLGARRTQLIDRIAGEIVDGGGQAIAVPLDVTDESSVMAAFDSAQQSFGTVDTAIANAAAGGTGR